ncbi:uncharacterized protein LOC116161485 [Photinus pyralis]|uniref:uncharacterized protein LOC116161485 n=1 Tax=Photinus pyralis TaxID=7054 RepID=UPI0012674FFF|nr:uncharacterized protein LOC116161485 [Photinus pyralis]
MKVCSAHFTKEDYILPDVAHKRKCLKKTVCPSRNLPQIRHQSAVNHKAKAKREDRYVRRQQLLEKSVRLEAADTLLLLANTEANTQTKEEEPVNEMCYETESSLNVLYKDVSVQVNTYLDQREFSIADIINNDYRIKFCTGISNVTLFNVIANTLSVQFATSNRNYTFCVRKRILLTLMKIKLGLSFRF